MEAGAPQGHNPQPNKGQPKDGPDHGQMAVRVVNFVSNGREAFAIHVENVVSNGQDKPVYVKTGKTVILHPDAKGWVRFSSSDEKFFVDEKDTFGQVLGDLILKALALSRIVQPHPRGAAQTAAAKAAQTTPPVVAPSRSTQAPVR